MYLKLMSLPQVSGVQVIGSSGASFSKPSDFPGRHCSPGEDTGEIGEREEHKGRKGGLKAESCVPIAGACGIVPEAGIVGKAEWRDGESGWEQEGGAESRQLCFQAASNEGLHTRSAPADL